MSYIKHILITLLLIIISFVLQTTLFSWFSFGGIVPNLLIILTAAKGFMQGEKSGIVVGFVCGFLIDIFFGNIIGLTAIIYMCIGYLNGLFHGFFYPDDIKLPMILILSSDFLYSLFYYMIFFLLRGRFDFRFYAVHIIIPEVVYTSLVTLIYYPILLLIHNLTNKSGKRGDRKFV